MLVQISAAKGPIECARAVYLALQAFCRDADALGCDLHNVEQTDGEKPYTLQSVILSVSGANAEQLIESWEGSVLWRCQSSYRPCHKRKNWFIGVSCFTPTETAYDDQIQYETCRASGPGGQHVNKTESAVRITHLKSGIVVQCQNERSQVQNKEIAMKMLMAKLIQKQKEEEKSKELAIEKKKIEWGSQIRSYILHPYKLVKDHRTELENPQPELVLDGDIMDFIEANLIKEKTK